MASADTGFTASCQLTHRLLPNYPVSVRRAVTVAPASFRPHLTVTPLPSLNGSDSLYRRGLSPPRMYVCPVYNKGVGHLCQIGNIGNIARPVAFGQLALVARTRAATCGTFSHSSQAQTGYPRYPSPNRLRRLAIDAQLPLSMARNVCKSSGYVREKCFVCHLAFETIGRDEHLPAHADCVLAPEQPRPEHTH